MNQINKAPIDKVVKPIQKFIHHQKSGGLILGITVIIALVLANSPLNEYYHHFFEQKLGFQFNGTSYLEYSIHHWINDGLMAIFFFVIGLELKREIVAGELSNPRKALLPIAAAIGGMLVPALVYIAFNPTSDVNSGWGIPMATDIAFALGVLYLLGNRIPLALKVFLTALAIIDDLGAVLVIAFFYTSDISILNLGIGMLFLLVMLIGNKIGVRSIMFYAILGIGGVWTAFLLSGVHATIASVLAAFMVPANVRIKEDILVARIRKHLNKFRRADPDDNIPTLTNEQLHIIERINIDTKQAMPPLQKLEHAMHPFVTFIIIPIFALANAGVTLLDINLNELFSTNVAIGVALGLLVGKVVGVLGFSWLCVKLKIAPFPAGMNMRNLLGLALLSSIGFTMSLFITELAFVNSDYKIKDKVGIFVYYIIGGFLGYLVLSKPKEKVNKSEN